MASSLPNSSRLNVSLDQFEGPLSLLLYLIKKEELDIYDIPIHTITLQYLEFIQIMKELNLEVAGEFVAMAATLIYIKSRMLVPQYNEHGEEVAVDPRKELVDQLLEYQRYQEAGKQLYKRPLLGRDVWARDVKELPKAKDEVIVDENGLFSLIAAFRALTKDVKKNKHIVGGRGQSISARLLSIKHHFKTGERIEIRSLLPEAFTKTDLVITFLSVLELARLKYIRVYQSEPFAPLYLETLREVTSDIVSRVQEFETDNEKAAADIMQEAQSQLLLRPMALEAEAKTQDQNLSDDAEIQAVETGDLI